MKLSWPKPGTYILAVSGGADSMVLLDLFARAGAERGYSLVVAHFDHNIHTSSAANATLVGTVASRHGLSFAVGSAAVKLTSEAQARKARYAFLEATKLKYRADAIITAHHHDDLVETSLLNLARGTDYRGLVPMRKGVILRPLLSLSRPELRTYAVERKLTWNEDPTNTDTSNPRNFLRHKLLPTASAAWSKHYLDLLNSLTAASDELGRLLDELIETDLQVIDQGYRLPSVLVRELSAVELEALLAEVIRRLRPELELSHRLVVELAHFAKVAKPGRWRSVRPPLRIVRERDATVVMSYTE